MKPLLVIAMTLLIASCGSKASSNGGSETNLSTTEIDALTKKISTVFSKAHVVETVVSNKLGTCQITSKVLQIELTPNISFDKKEAATTTGDCSENTMQLQVASTSVWVRTKEQSINPESNECLSKLTKKGNVYTAHCSGNQTTMIDFDNKIAVQTSENEELRGVTTIKVITPNKDELINDLQSVKLVVESTKEGATGYENYNNGLPVNAIEILKLDLSSF